MSDYVSRQYLLDEYDRQHQGPPGGARKIIAEAPAADVVRVVHGRWMPQKGGGLCCSECGGYALDEPDGNFIHVAVPSNFCPNCGAKMDAR